MNFELKKQQSEFIRMKRWARCQRAHRLSSTTMLVRNKSSAVTMMNLGFMCPDWSWDKDKADKVETPNYTDSCCVEIVSLQEMNNQYRHTLKTG